MPTSTVDSSRQTALLWTGLAVAALLLAGTFSLGLVVARVPPFSHLVTDAGFFKRLLVVHVDLALVVWFYAFVVGLLHLFGSRVASSAARQGWALASLGVVAMVCAAFVPGTTPILANYVPVIDHPVFVAGLGMFALGVVVAVGSARLGARMSAGAFPVHDDARLALRAASVALITAAATFAVAAMVTPRTLASAAYYELVAWGGGHVLQVASEAAMLGVWLFLLGSALGRAILRPRTARVLFALLVGPHLLMPVFAALGTTEPLYYHGATRLMQFGIFPVVILILGICLRALMHDRGHERRWRWSDPRVIGFLVSAALAVTGFVIGAMIRGSSTMIPAHYHASIGAVTVSFMTVAVVVVAPHLYGVGAHSILGEHAGSIDISGRWRRLQPVLFGGGQLVFAIGFGMAGANGMARKAYGPEQTVRSLTDWIGLGTMGIGGLVAVAGGLLFLGIILRAAMTAVTNAHTPVPNLLPGRPS